MAAAKGHLEIVNTLIKHGANIEIVPRYNAFVMGSGGSTALIMAARLGHKERIILNPHTFFLNPHTFSKNKFMLKKNLQTSNKVYLLDKAIY